MLCTTTYLDVKVIKAVSVFVQGTKCRPLRFFRVSMGVCERISPVVGEIR